MCSAAEKKMSVDELCMLLVPEGMGVYAVSTGKKWREELYQYRFSKDVTEQWKERLLTLLQDKSSLPLVLGAPSDNGAGIIRGSNWGPLFLRLESEKVGESFAEFDLGDLPIIPHFLEDEYLSQKQIELSRKALYGETSLALPVSPLSQLRRVIFLLKKLTPKKPILVLGGDHSLSLPILESMSLKGTAILHFDAHTDLMSSRLGVDHCFGSWAYHARSLLDSPAHLAQIGIRASGSPKEHWEKTLGVKQWWSSEVNEHTASDVLNHFKSLGVTSVYISLDVDVLSVDYLSCTGTAEEGGLNLDTVIQIIQVIKNHFPVVGADLVELAPFISSPLKKDYQPEPQTSLLSAQLLLRQLLCSLGAF
jgi:agmatinase